MGERCVAHWTLQDIPWDEFDPAGLAPDVVNVVKAAAMVEKNAGDYATYLCNVFCGDEAFQNVAKAWAGEEIQHGDVLGCWAEMADPDFDFAARFDVFQKGYQIPIGATRSVRGSCSGELVARCVVEAGTSSYYTALRDFTKEPVLKAICGHIAADEFRHYALFHAHLLRYLPKDRLGILARIRIVLGRIGEADDDELSYAYFAGNNQGEVYDRGKCSAAYGSRASGFYQPANVHRATNMALEAAGFSPDGALAKVSGKIAWWALNRHRAHLKDVLAG
jgi:hypothetical protein